MRDLPPAIRGLHSRQYYTTSARKGRLGRSVRLSQNSVHFWGCAKVQAQQVEAVSVQVRVSLRRPCPPVVEMVTVVGGVVCLLCPREVRVAGTLSFDTFPHGLDSGSCPHPMWVTLTSRPTFPLDMCKNPSL